MDLTKVAFSSTVNYLKRDALSGSTALTLPAYGGNVSATITHNLGYIPFFQVLCDFNNDGKIWSAIKINDHTGTSKSGPPDPPEPSLRAWATTTTLVIRLDNNTNPTATGTRTVYYVIYRDYGNA